MVERAWSSADLAHALCDALVKRGQLKEKPAFIRSDREQKIVGIFEGIGLDGEKMESFDNPGPLEMLVRRGTTGEAWVQQVIDALVEMLPEEVKKNTKKMGMDEQTKAELEEVKERSAQRRERQQEGGEGGDGGRRDDGGRDKGKGGNRTRDGDREERGSGWNDAGSGNRNRGGEREERGWGDSGGGRSDSGGGKGREGGYNSGGGDREDRGGWGDAGGGKGRRPGGTDNMECYNCSGMGHSSRDCPEPRKESAGKGKGKRDRSAMQCNNCGQNGHKSRDCPEPVDEEKVRQRLAAKAEKEGKSKAQSGSDREDSISSTLRGLRGKKMPLL